MCFAQGLQRSDAGEARTRGPSVSSQPLNHWATALPTLNFDTCRTYVESFFKNQINQPAEQPGLAYILKLGI